jgi:hypothetical protein
MKYIKKYNESLTVGGDKNEELDLEYVKNCLVDLLDNPDTKIYYKYQYKIISPLKKTIWISKNWTDDKDWIPQSNKFDDEKQVIGIKIVSKVDGLIPESVSDIPDWCDRVKRMSNSILGGERNIKEEYPDYYISTHYEENGYNDEPANCLIFKIEVLTK